MPNALPDLDLNKVDTGMALLGRRLKAPILIASMTGGPDEARKLNRTLAEAAQRHGLAMGLGSGRILIENPSLLPSFDIRALAPDVLLLANLGAVQLNRGVTIDDCRWLCGILRADGLILHLNPVQEALQARGEPSFAGLLPKIAAVVRGLGHPVIVKEVGFGLSPDVVRQLLGAGVAAVDLAGAGGTAWTLIDEQGQSEEWRARLCRDFGEWGLPTVDALRLARAQHPDALIFASGGVRTGLDIAKAMALGADLVGIGRPFLQAAHDGAVPLDAHIRRLVEGLRIAMFAAGAGAIKSLRGTPVFDAMP